jgi:hypothetical protein
MNAPARRAVGYPFPAGGSADPHVNPKPAAPLEGKRDGLQSEGE